MSAERVFAGVFAAVVMGAGALLSASCASMTSANGPANYSGPELYETFCATCHGRAGHGDGPVAPLLKAHVPDLTMIAARHGGTFPADEVYRHIDGQAGDPSHGPRNMPVWGYEFYGDEMDDEAAHKEATKTIERLVKQLRSMQRPYQ